MALLPRPDGNDGLEPEIWEITLIDSNGNPSVIGWARISPHPNPNVHDRRREGWVLKPNVDFPLNPTVDEKIQVRRANEDFPVAIETFHEFDAAVKAIPGYDDTVEYGIMNVDTAFPVGP